MDTTLLVIQTLNGLQLGLLLFLVASGLTLVFGILDFVNLAHGSLYMLGAFICASLTLCLGKFPAGRLGRAADHRRCRAGGRTVRGAHALSARSSRPGAGDLRADPGDRHARAHLIWGPEGMAVPLPALAGWSGRPDRDAGAADLSAGDHWCRTCQRRQACSGW